MTDAKQKAQAALLNAIATKAKGADVDGLGTLATAYQQVVHGPQGGDMQYASGQTYQYTATTEATSHSHTHAHDPSRNGVGFKA